MWLTTQKVQRITKNNTETIYIEYNNNNILYCIKENKLFCFNFFHDLTAFKGTNVSSGVC